MRTLVWLALLPLAACATRHAPVVAPTAPLDANRCPDVPAPWLGEPVPRADLRCVGPLWEVGHQATPQEADLERAGYLVCHDYAGPDGLPYVAMLAGALTELTRVYPALRFASSADGHFLLVFGERATEVGPAKREPLSLFVKQLVRAAQFARAALPADQLDAHGSPEHLLLRGALAALAWPSYLLTARDESIEAPLPRPGDIHYPDVPSMGIVDAHGLAHLAIFTIDEGLPARMFRLLARQPVHGVIIDLRHSSGGLWDAALSFIDLFVRRGCIATKRPNPNSGEHAGDDKDDIDAPLVVLIGPQTAAGAELVAATLRATGRAILVGEHTAGVGTLKTVSALPSGALACVATGELLDGAGQPFAGRGVLPDIVLPTGADASSDRPLALAVDVLTQRQGDTRADLLRAAAALTPKP